MNWINRLKEKWKVKNSSQFALILITFALTGSTVIIIKKPIVDYFTIDGERSTIFTIIYLICILPIYNIILLFYGSLLGQFDFFWNYEKKMINRFRRKKKGKKMKNKWLRFSIEANYSQNIWMNMLIEIFKAQKWLLSIYLY